MFALLEWGFGLIILKGLLDKTKDFQLSNTWDKLILKKH